MLKLDLEGADEKRLFYGCHWNQCSRGLHMIQTHLKNCHHFHVDNQKTFDSLTILSAFQVGFGS